MARKQMTMLMCVLVMSVVMNLAFYLSLIESIKLPPSISGIDMPYNDSIEAQNSRYSYFNPNIAVGNLVNYGKSLSNSTVNKVGNFIRDSDWNVETQKLYDLLRLSKLSRNTTFDAIYDVYNKFKSTFGMDGLNSSESDEKIREGFVKTIENFTVIEVNDEDEGPDYDDSDTVSMETSETSNQVNATDMALAPPEIQESGGLAEELNMVNAIFPAPLKSRAGFPVDVKRWWNATRVVYNCVDRCGSQTFLAIIGVLSFEHGYQSVVNRVKRYNLTMKRQEIAMRNVVKRPPPYVFNRQVHFLDFSQIGMQPPAYINLIREPLPRFLSWYYTATPNESYPDTSQRIYPQFQDHRRLSFDECVLANHPACMESNAFQIIPYFCGQIPECRLPSRWALERAKKRVVRDYVFVGILEDLENTLLIFEKLMPRFFHSALKVYKTMIMGLKKYDYYKNIPSPVPSQEAVQEMSKRLTLEYEFYNFVRERQELLKTQLYTFIDQDDLTYEAARAQQQNIIPQVFNYQQII